MLCAHAQNTYRSHSYAILGVELFGNGVVEFECNQAYFDNYSQSMLTLMQVS